MIFRNYVSYVELHGILSQFWAIFAFHIDPLGKPKFDIDQIDRPVLAGQFESLGTNLVKRAIAKGYKMPAATGDPPKPLSSGSHGPLRTTAGRPFVKTDIVNLYA